MLISVWISDVCSSDLWTETEIIEPQIAERGAALGVERNAAIASLLSEKQPSQRTSDPAEIGNLALWLCSPAAHNVPGVSIPVDGRSEEGSVGKEWVSTGRYGWLTYN